MTDELVLYTHPMSRGRIARWMMEEVGAPYRAELLTFAGSMKTPDFLAINPMGKVPTLRHGDVVVTEGAAICAYIADAFPQAGLAPPHGDPARGAYYRWLFYSAGPIEAAVTNKALGFDLPPGKSGMAGYGSFGDVMDTMDHALAGGGYLAGGRFSAADVVFGSQIGFGLAFGTIEKRPAFLRYWDLIQNRPAAIRAREIDDALIAQEKAASSG